MYEDEDGPSPEPVEVPKTAIVLKVVGWEAERVEAMVAEKIEEWVTQELRAQLGTKIEAAVEQATQSLVRDRLAVEIERVLAEGWQPTGEYGEAKGPKKTLKDRISDLLNHQDRYSSNRRWLDELIADHVRKVLSGPFAGEVEGAKASFRKQVDELLAGHIANGLRTAFGLR